MEKNWELQIERDLCPQIAPWNKKHPHSINKEDVLGHLRIRVLYTNLCMLLYLFVCNFRHVGHV